MNKKYIVRLTAKERRILGEVVKKLTGSNQKLRRAQMLLKADVAGPAWTDERIAEAFDNRTSTIEKPYDPAHPVLCMDEQPVQLINETRQPIPATRRHARRIDYEYERAGTASIFMFTEPLAGWREATARATKTKRDWALEVARLLEGRYRKCPRVTLVCDNLNTHTIGAFYEAFTPARARALVRRIHFCPTPKHGSWLNIAENELSSLTRQCVAGRRFGKLTTLQSELAAWSTDANTRQRGVDWQMKTRDARCRLKALYPKIML